MSDLAGNPNCWFSHTKAHLFFSQLQTIIHLCDNSLKHLSAWQNLLQMLFTRCRYRHLPTNLFLYTCMFKLYETFKDNYCVQKLFCLIQLDLSREPIQNLKLATSRCISNCSVAVFKASFSIHLLFTIYRL